MVGGNIEFFWGSRCIDFLHLMMLWIKCYLTNLGGNLKSLGGGGGGVGDIVPPLKALDKTLYVCQIKCKMCRS